MPVGHRHFLFGKMSALGPGVCEILCVPFKRGISVSYSPLALPKSSTVGLQSQTFWGFFFLVQDSWAGEPNVGLGTLRSLGRRTSAIVIILPFVGHLPGVWVIYLGCGSLLCCISALPTQFVVVPSPYL